MSTFKFDSIIQEFPRFDKNELFIWVWNADKIPPHLGLSYGKNYHSLTYKGVDHFPTGTMIRKIKRSEIPMLFIQVKKVVSQDLEKLFLSFERAKPGLTTCLSPIKQALDLSDNEKQLSVVLEVLQSQHQLQTVFGAFLPENYTSLPVYSWQDIVSRIEVLNAEK